MSSPACLFLLNPIPPLMPEKWHHQSLPCENVVKMDQMGIGAFGVPRRKQATNSDIIIGRPETGLSCYWVLVLESSGEMAGCTQAMWLGDAALQHLFKEVIGQTRTGGMTAVCVKELGRALILNITHERLPLRGMISRPK